MAVIDGNIASSYESFDIFYFGSTSDNSWKERNQAGVSVTQLHRQSAIGFRADKTGDQSRCTGGTTVSNWNTHKTLLSLCVKSSSCNTVTESSITPGCCKYPFHDNRRLFFAPFVARISAQSPDGNIKNTCHLMNSAPAYDYANFHVQGFFLPVRGTAGYAPSFAEAASSLADPTRSFSSYTLLERNGPL